MNDVVDQILSAFREAGKAGLRIKDVVDRLGVDSKEASSGIMNLVSEGKIMQKATDDERYMIRTSLGEELESGSLSDMDGCPCYHCLRIGRCGTRQPDSPLTCKDLEEWIIAVTA